MRGRFEGWYYKHQGREGTLALIPGRAEDGAFIQVITDNNSYNVTYSVSEYFHNDVLHVGGSVFGAQGISLDINSPSLTLTGFIGYRGLTPLCGDIMGPFRFFPMECRHEVVSMCHELAGAVVLNGKVINFSEGVGYIEADCGRSFPRGYAWVHGSDFERECSVMASVARIPFFGLNFWGCICVVWLGGREYRLATYNGVKILRCEPGVIELKQGKYRLAVTVDSCEGHALNAPVSGNMKRVIRESLSVPARFRFMEGDRLLLDKKISQTSYEYAIESGVTRANL